MVRRLVPWLLLGLAGCMEGQKPTPLARTAPTAPVLKDSVQVAPSLYQRLGGHTAVEKVVDDFVDAVAADDKIRPEHKKQFQEGDVDGLKRKLVDQIGAATGGPERYTGRNMKDAHKGLGITDAEFDAFMADFVKALDKNNVPAKEQQELKTHLKSMHDDIVERPD